MRRIAGHDLICLRTNQEKRPPLVVALLRPRCSGAGNMAQWTGHLQSESQRAIGHNDLAGTDGERDTCPVKQLMFRIAGNFY